MFDNIVATGSFDNAVRVHDIKKNTITTLLEHKDRVRSLVFNPEMPWILVSAADDSQVVVWDLRTKKILTSIIEPTLPMTSLISHPISPFTLISCHFDSSILFWSLINIPHVALAQLKLLLGSTVDSIYCEPGDAYTNTDHSAKLSGKQSKKLSERQLKMSEIE